MEKQIEVAVNWWADQLANGTRQDNGDAMTSVLMGMLSGSMKPITVEQLQTFKDALTEALKVAVTQRHFHSIYNDYHCDRLLYDAAKVAGIEADCPPFPIKTCMWINADRVSVRHGYGAKEQLLWGTEKAAAA